MTWNNLDRLRALLLTLDQYGTFEDKEIIEILKILIEDYIDRSIDYMD